MDTSQKDRKAIKLTNCRVQKELTKPDPEIFLNNHSQIAKSPREIHVPDHLLPANGAIQMSEIKSVADMAKITAQIKVVNVQHPTKIRTQLGKELLKQDCLVADSSACCRLVAWEKDVDSLLEGKSYKLKDVNIRQFKGTKYLSIGVDCQIEAIEDIGEVIEIETQNDNCDPLTRVFEAEIVGAWCTNCKGCTSCKTKIESHDGIVAECRNCGMMMKFSTCPKYCTSKIRVVETNGNQRDLTIFNDILGTIVEDCETQDKSAIKTKLLLLPGNLRFCTDTKNIVLSVSKL